MTVRQLYQSIGAKQSAATRLARRLELADRVSDWHGSPAQPQALRDAQRLRIELSRLYTEIHTLEARLPTPEVLSERAFNRALALGLEIEAAEGLRLKAYREARQIGLAG
jgi:hypothetical protein